MSTEMDFKALWNKQPASDIPDTKELMMKADNLKRKTRVSLIKLNLMLIAVSIFIIVMGWHIDNVKIATKIGIGLMVIAMISYLIAYNQIIPILFKTDIEISSRDYLNQLIRIKRKEDFLNKVMINIYFTLLTVGLFLYMLQFAARMSPGWTLFYYGITFAWIALGWFYLRPRGVKKKQKALNEVIERLESVNGQFEVE